jgi:hypothetical protein
MASGAILVQVEMRSAPVVSLAPWDAQVVGFCTGDTDIGPLSIDGGVNTITFRRGYLTGDIHAGNAADLSQGKGFLAPAIEGVCAFADLVASSTRALSNLISAGDLNPYGAAVRFASITSGSSPVVTPLGQFSVVEPTPNGAVVEFALKSPAYITNKPFWGIRTASQMVSDPLRPGTPTAEVVTQFAGVAFGNIDQTVKAANAIPAQRLAFFADTNLAKGVITTSATNADVVTTKADHYADQKDAPTGGGWPTEIGSGMYFTCRDDAEALRLYNLIVAYQTAGYRIIVGGGSWFLDVTTYTPWNGPIIYNSSSYKNATSGAAFGWDPSGSYPACVWFNLTNSDLEQQFPVSGITASECEIFAVSKTITALAHQAIVKGFAKNGKTVAINGEASIDGELTLFLPSVTSSDGMFGRKSRSDINLVFDASSAPMVLGGIQELNDDTLITIGGGGDIANIITDPSVGWDGTSADAWFFAHGHKTSGSGPDWRSPVDVALRCAPSNTEMDGDFVVVDSTWYATWLPSYPSNVGYCYVYVRGVFEEFDGRKDKVYNSTSAGVTLRHTANRNPTEIRWRAKFDALADLQAHKTPRAGYEDYGIGTVFGTVEMHVMECFIWEYSKIGFSELYPVVFPFWTSAKCSAIAANGSVAICDTGRGVISADGSIIWTSFVLPTPNNTFPQVVSAVYSGTNAWMMAGWTDGLFADGGGPCVWTSVDDGVTWSHFQLDTSLYATKVTRLRTLSGVGWFTTFDGRVANPFTISPLSAGIPLWDIAFDGTHYLIVGNNGFATWTTDFLTFTSVGVGGAGNHHYAATFFGGRFYLGGAGGDIYRATVSEMLAGTWHLITGQVSGDIDDMTANGSSVLAVSVYGVYASDDGATWRNRLDDGNYVAPSAYGWSFGLAHTVVGSTDVWIMGGMAQIATSTGSDQGNTSIVPDWTPWNTPTPGSALAKIRARYFGGMGRNFNPVRWTYGGGLPATPSTNPFGITFDPPDIASGPESQGTRADFAAEKICQERWIFAGEMSATSLDGSNDAIELAFPHIPIGAIQDVATLITAKYKPFGGEYLGQAYIQNVDIDRATAGKPDEFFFSGWDASGNTNGLAIWTACRAAYLVSGSLRPIALTYDSIHDAQSLGNLWRVVDADLGSRISWLCKRPRYLEVTVTGNASAAARAFSGCRYKANQTLLAARGLGVSGTGYGLVVSSDHDYRAGNHHLTVAFPPA